MKVNRSVLNLIAIAIAFLIWLIALIIFFNYSIESSNLKLLLLSIIMGILVFFVGWFIKKYSLKEFLQSLLPTSATILGTIWLLSTGYLDIKAENLKNDISKFKNDTLELKMNLRVLKNSKDSLKSLNEFLIEEKDSLIITNKILKSNSQKKYSILEIENAKLNYETQKYHTILKNKPVIIVLETEKNGDNYESKKIEYIFPENHVQILDKNLNILNAESISVFQHAEMLQPLPFIEKEKRFIVSPMDIGLYKISSINGKLISESGYFQFTITNSVRNPYSNEVKYIKNIKLPLGTSNYTIILNDFTKS